MATALLDSPPVRTLDILLAKLGDIPTSRIIASPAPGTATEEDCIRMNERIDARACELLDGTLVEKAVGFEESILGSWLLQQIGNFVALHKLGALGGEQGMLKLGDGRIRMPDIAYFSWKNIRGVKRAAAPMMVPDLIVEVLSPSNTAREIERKRRDFFQFGTELFWKVDPVRRIIEVHTPTGKPRTLGAADTLTGGKVLPGFELKMDAIFEYLDSITDQMDG